MVDSLGRPKYELTESEHDRICDAEFPGDKVIRNAYMTKKRAKSYTGAHIDLANVANMAAPETMTARMDVEKLREAGGERLVALYSASMNYGLAAEELGIGEAALRKWFSRWLAESPATARSLARLVN